MKSEVVIVFAKDYDSTTGGLKKSMVLPEFKLWRKDSSIIEEIKRTDHHTDTTGHTTIKTFLDHYTFVDLKTGSYYNYSSFSDTAKLLKIYSSADRAELIGWDFTYYRGEKKTQITRPVEALPDTTIENILFKRYKIFFLNNNPTNPVELGVMGYARCNKRGTLFDYGISLGTVQACPITRMDYMVTKADPLPLSFQTEFVSDTLSQEELKVFAAWEKYAKENPVK